MDVAFFSQQLCRRRSQPSRSRERAVGKTAEEIESCDGYRSVAAPNLSRVDPRRTWTTSDAERQWKKCHHPRPASELVTPGEPKPGKLRPSYGTGLPVFQAWLQAGVGPATLQRSGRPSDCRDHNLKATCRTISLTATCEWLTCSVVLSSCTVS
ncbi:hypothetical protein HPB51_000926 [Rhipicephalus microplus]|uniref:Uncharacterized protein n=1 Tax=Rhipicephalus microplus TaxID=6941 RepID=A0A9J6DKI0_RHIMP|nr:hypothetical protein HPB51_000926 [Rhipicephalus microplus]